MKFFEQYFLGTDFNTGAEEIKVLCPFHNDTHPSASVNTKKDVFHCWVCDVGYNEQQFLAHINNISLSDANKVVLKLNETHHDWKLVEKAELWANPTFLKKLEDMGFNRNVIDELNLGIVKDEQNRLYLGYPVFYNNVLMDVRRYNLLKIENIPKLMSNKGAEMGFIIPYDIWKSTNNTTYILEGEKDMLLARSLGINAITFTGGANATPNDYVLSTFKDRDVVVCYDNDDAGKAGMDKVYQKLSPIVKSIKFVNIGEVVLEKGEDFYDFVMKYKKTVDDFYALPLHDFTIKEKPKKKYTPIKKALKDNSIKHTLTTQIVVSAEYGDVYAVPTMVEFEKTNNDDEGNMLKGEKKSWVLDESDHKQILELIEVDAKAKNVNAVLKRLANLNDEKGLNITVKEYKTIYKVKVAGRNEDNENISLDLYSFTPMFVGKEYEIVYSIYTHPNKHQKLVSIAKEVQEIGSYNDFQINKEILNNFKGSGTIDERVNRLFQSAKHHIAKHLKYDLWFMADLVFNSILEIDYNGIIKGALDIFILGDTQVGKSETTSHLVDLYHFGHFLSLKTSTTVGLIGGSTKVDGSWLNTIGAIPKQHTRLVVLEEFSGAKPDFIKTLTDIRSSGRVRLARAAGELNVPCRLRMISISNPINDTQGNPRFLSTFPNGVIPLMELIPSAEDVARYDGFLLVEKVKERVNPFGLKLESEPIPKEYYEHKIQWVATRKPEDVVFAEGSDSYIWEKAEELNKVFESNFPLFGTTTPLKLARFSVALASLIVNTDETFEKVVVTKEIVDFIINYLKRIYDNTIFKLKDYKIEFESYNALQDGDLDELEKLWSRNATLLDFLANQSSTSRNNLRVISGLETDDFAKIFNIMTKLKMIRLHGENVYPTEKFRLGMSKIDKSTRLDTGRIETKDQNTLAFKTIKGKENTQ